MASPTTVHLEATLTSLNPALLGNSDSTMSRPSAQTKSAAGTKAAPSKSTEIKGLENDVWTLLFAAHPTLIPNVKVMAAVDEKGRTMSQLEHQLRKYRHAGKELGEQKAQILEGLVKNDDGGKKRKSMNEDGGKTGAAKKGKPNAEDDGTEDKEDIPVKKAKVVKKGTAKKGKPDADDDATEEEVIPAKRAKVVKKGTAKVVKKVATGGTKPKASLKGNTKTNAKAKKGKEVEQAEDATADEEGGDVEEGDAGVGEEDGDVEEDDNGMVDMQFER
ncbi:MAG: hypothetical protein FRX48_06338 [Lasallia pustulata]|uniref:Uncharacterized protein n=1 Tax=Lasallia pustulata TaxID=136370 RepID=A0A5M8PLW2_9LECA|nr:MAG: hypothetical protein FRX48_06338 [Lasallia pustulata]